MSPSKSSAIKAIKTRENQLQKSASEGTEIGQVQKLEGKFLATFLQIKGENIALSNLEVLILEGWKTGFPELY